MSEKRSGFYNGLFTVIGIIGVVFLIASMIIFAMSISNLVNATATTQAQITATQAKLKSLSQEQTLPSYMKPVIADDGTTAYIDGRYTSLTSKQLNEIGRVSCEEMDFDTFIATGVVENGITHYTYVSDDFLDFAVLASTVPGWHVRDDGAFCDGDGNVVCASGIRALGDVVYTPLGKGVVYDYGSDIPTITIFIHENK